MMTEYAEGKVELKRDGAIIKVVLTGSLTEELTVSLTQEIEAELLKRDSSGILYNSMYMNDPPLKLVFLMQSFQKRMNTRIRKCAIVVPGYRLAYLSRLAFGEQESKYRVFYNDPDEAIAWLNQ